MILVGVEVEGESAFEFEGSDEEEEMIDNEASTILLLSQGRERAREREQSVWITRKWGFPLPDRIVNLVLVIAVDTVCVPYAIISFHLFPLARYFSCLW